jgi:hypothetical protein
MRPADGMAYFVKIEIAAPAIMDQPAFDLVQYGFLTGHGQCSSFFMHEKIGVKQ